MLNFKTSQQWSTMLVTALCVAGMAACTTPHKSVETAPPNPLEHQEVTLYEREGLTIALPNAHLEELLVLSEPEWESEEGTTLITVYEKQSYEESAQDYGEDSHAGYLFSLARYTRVQYERFLCSDGSGQRFFARDDTYYYGYFTATDVQFYRAEGVIDTEADEWKAWEALCEMGRAVADDFIVRNGLTAYSDSKFFGRDFTYDSEHLYVTYSGENVGNTLVLSQPATQGGTGIWCVERWHDNNYGNLYYAFPAEDRAAQDVYTALQAACDSGQRPELLDPIQVATEFLTARRDLAPKEGSVQLVAGTPGGNVLRLCNEVFDQMGTLQAATLAEDGSRTDEDALGVPDYYDRPFSSYAASNLYPLLWLKAEKPTALSGSVVYCYNAEKTKTLAFYQQNGLLCVIADGTERWFQPAYAYERTPFDRMYSFYTEFYAAAHPAPQHSYSDAEVQGAIDAPIAFASLRTK